jgi:ribonuclease P protein component
LTQKGAFQALFQQGKRIDRSSLIVLWRETGGARRAGFAVSRQLRGAVQRNRAKRRLREAYRWTRTAAPAGVAVVLVARPSALRVSFETLVSELRLALRAIPRLRSSQ